MAGKFKLFNCLQVAFTNNKKQVMICLETGEGDIKMGAARTEEEINAIKATILMALETVIDPELGVDIVNLGLIYEVEYDDATGNAEIKMTLTTMGCPLADILTESIYEVLSEIPEVNQADVKLVWYPPWTPEKMSRYARIALGIR